MSFSLYSSTIPLMLRGLDGAAKTMAKGRAYCTEQGLDLEGMTEKRLADDMLPFHFQVNSVCHHSKRAIDGVFAGTFSPPPPIEDTSHAGLELLVAESIEALKGLSENDINSCVGKDVTFVMGERKIPFTAEGFLMSFSLPNFYFHFTMIYAILRNAGVPLGKIDYLSQLDIKR